MDGKKITPGRLESRKYARRSSAIVAPTAGVTPATFDMRKVNANSWTPYPLIEMGISVIKYVRLHRPAIIQKETCAPKEFTKI